jgi:flagellar protein FlaF
MENYRAAPTNIYQQNQKSVETPRDVDAMVLRVAAERLQEAQRTPDDDVFEQTLQYNQLIWTVIQSAMTEDNPLPPEVKANLVSLSRFVDNQTAKALGRREAALVDVLITINRNISAGLST